MSSGRFKYLKRNIEVVEGGVTIRPDAHQIEELAELCGVTKQKPRTTPTDHKFNKLTKEDEKVAEGEVTRFGSCIGKLLYIAPDRPDVQFVAQGLASLMQQPTKTGWRYVKRVSSYLFGTRDEGILLESGPKGRSVLHIDNADGERSFEFEDGEKSLLEVVCDDDYAYAGDQRTRRSVSSVQIYLDGNLMESYVRCQKSIALSSGESEYIAMVGGVSEAMFIQHCWEFLTGDEPELMCRSDSSAARSLAQRVGIGRSRHIAASMLRIQQKVVAFNPADTGTKCLSKARMKGLKYIIKMINGDDEKIGRKEYEEIAVKEEARQATTKVAKSFGANAKVAAVIAMALIRGVTGNNTETQDTSDSTWIKVVVTVSCLAVVGALSLATIIATHVKHFVVKMTEKKEEVKEKPQVFEEAQDEIDFWKREAERFEAEAFQKAQEIQG